MAPPPGAAKSKGLQRSRGASPRGELSRLPFSAAGKRFQPPHVAAGPHAHHDARQQAPGGTQRPRRRRRARHRSGHARREPRALPAIRQLFRPASHAGQLTCAEARPRRCSSARRHSASRGLLRHARRLACAARLGARQWAPFQRREANRRLRAQLAEAGLAALAADAAWLGSCSARCFPPRPGPLSAGSSPRCGRVATAGLAPEGLTPW